MLNGHFVNQYTHEIREPATAYGKQNLTIEEYLQFEKASTEKHEYYQGGDLCYVRRKQPAQLDF
jgi:hypothetical protein